MSTNTVSRNVESVKPYTKDGLFHWYWRVASGSLIDRAVLMALVIEHCFEPFEPHSRIARSDQLIASLLGVGEAEVAGSIERLREAGLVRLSAADARVPMHRTLVPMIRLCVTEPEPISGEDFASIIDDILAKHGTREVTQ